MSGIEFSPNLVGKLADSYLDNVQQSATDERLESVGKDFEGVFLSLLLKEMRGTLENGGFFGEENSDSYGGMFDLFIGQHLADSTPLGIAELVLNSYKQNQEPEIDPSGHENTKNEETTPGDSY